MAQIYFALLSLKNTRVKDAAIYIYATDRERKLQVMGHVSVCHGQTFDEGNRGWHVVNPVRDRTSIVVGRPGQINVSYLL